MKFDRFQLPGAKWQPSFKNFYSVVNSKLKENVDSEYRTTPWELLADSIGTSKRNKYSLEPVECFVKPDSAKNQSVVSQN